MAGLTIKVTEGGSTADAVAHAVEVLRNGGLVAFPTETVYGIGARVDLPSAMAKLRRVKDRHDAKAFTVHIGEPGAATGFAPEMPEVAARLIRRSWPGPLTLIIAVDDPAQAPVTSSLEATAMAAIYYQNSVGLRCPADAVAREILRQAGAPVAAASANRAGKRPPRSGSEVAKHFRDGFELLVDAGRTRYAKASTIVRVDGNEYKVVRPGVYDKRMIDEMAALRIMFVCTGNTCRSPMAAGLARKTLAGRLGCEMSELASRGIVLESAGTAGGWGGASAHAVTVMERRGINIANHESTALSAAQLRRADHIFAMTRGHRAAILEAAPDVEDRVCLMLGDADVADPAGKSEDEYERCLIQIERGLQHHLRELRI